MLAQFNISPQISSILVMLFPLLAFFWQALRGKKAGSGNISLLAIVCSTLISLIFVFMEVWNQSPLTSQIPWFTVGKVEFSVGILLNNWTVLMQFVVCIVALPVHIYSRAYMKGDTGIHRYWMYLSLFCFAMLGLCISLNLLQMYIFWELVGFASYLLIGFWFTKDAAVQANKKAFIINRIGDLGFLIGIALLYSQYGTLDIIALFGKEGIFNGGAEGMMLVDKDATWLTVAGIAFFIGAIAKSAQFPLHVWLPDAMEGPTSVSSLIHAATMVAAGVFLLVTIFPIFNELVLLLIVIIGSITAALSAYFALAQYDLKKILAFSTISQLGFMMVAVGIGAWDAAMFHLTTHAFFKCLLFLCAGAVIHEMNHLKQHSQGLFDPQDLRNMGGLRSFMPKTCLLMIVASLALTGFPLTSGFQSKDSIIISCFEWASAKGSYFYSVPVLLIVVSIATAFYSGRMIFKTFFGTFRLPELLGSHSQLHEAPKTMLYPMFFLAIACLFPVFSFHPFHYSQSWIIRGLQVDYAFEAVHDAHIYIPLILLFGSITAWLLSWRWYVKGNYPLNPNAPLIKAAFHQGYFNTVYTYVFVDGVLKLSQIIFWFDRNVVDGMTRLLTRITQNLAQLSHFIDKYVVDGLVNGVANSTYYIGHLLRQVQNGRLQGYLGFAFSILLLGIIYLIFS